MKLKEETAAELNSLKEYLKNKREAKINKSKINELKNLDTSSSEEEEEEEAPKKKKAVKKAKQQVCYSSSSSSSGSETDDNSRRRSKKSKPVQIIVNNGSGNAPQPQVKQPVNKALMFI